MTNCCGCTISCREEKKPEKYKCETCGAVSEKSGSCCGKPKEKLCSCGSGKLAKNCCQE